MFDVADATEFQGLLEKATAQDVSVPKPDNLGVGRGGILAHSSPVNIRRGPGTNYEIIQTAAPQARLTVYPTQTAVQSNTYSWFWVEVPTTNIAGWMAVLGGKTFAEFFEPISEPPPTDDRRAKIAELAAALRFVADKLDALSGDQT